MPLNYRDGCFGCEYYDPGSDGVNTREEYQEAEEPMCCEPHLMEIAENNDAAAVLMTQMLFWMSNIGNCPLKRNKLPRSIRDIAATRGAYRSRDNE